MKEVLIIMVAYLIGSIPSSVWISKYFFEVDIRDYGSTNRFKSKNARNRNNGGSRGGAN